MFRLDNSLILGLVIDHGNVGFIPNVDGQHPLGGRFSFPSFPAQNSQESVHFTKQADGDV